MYFCYVDESGDCGSYDATKPEKTGSAFFILAAIIVAANKWKVSLGTLKAFRKKIAREGYLPYHIEFHCAEMMMELFEHKKTPVPNRGFVPGLSEVVQPRWSRWHKYTTGYRKIQNNYEYL